MAPKANRNPRNLSRSRMLRPITPRPTRRNPPAHHGAERPERSHHNNVCFAPAYGKTRAGRSFESNSLWSHQSFNAELRASIAGIPRNEPSNHPEDGEHEDGFGQKA